MFSINKVSVHKGIFNGSRKGKTFEWAPAAFIQDILAGNGGRSFEVDDHEVGKIAFPDKTSLRNFKAPGNGMAHLVHHFFNT